jgi:pimeloyl-ACP methyl ester carboxylesterase
LFASVALVGLAIAGAVYQAVSVERETRRFPPPGQLVDIGGRRLHLVCIGDGGPVVIFEASGFSNALSSSVARTEISAHTRVCSYDRAGTGWSDPGPSIITAGLLADDLARLLEHAGVAPPYILVPASIGGLTSEMFARRHADRVAGLIFLDAATSDGVELAARRANWLVTVGACLVPMAARLGLLRWLDPFHFRRESSDPAARSAALLYRPEPMSTLCAMVRGADNTVDEFRAAPPLAADVPLVVLTGETAANLVPPGLAFLAQDPATLISQRRDLAHRARQRSLDREQPAARGRDGRTRHDWTDQEHDTDQALGSRFEHFSGPGPRAPSRPRTSSAFQAQDFGRSSGPGPQVPV